MIKTDSICVKGGWEKKESLALKISKMHHYENSKTTLKIIKKF